MMVPPCYDAMLKTQKTLVRLCVVVTLLAAGITLMAVDVWLLKVEVHHLRDGR